jgi:anti-anti-sigma factor
MTVVSTRSFYIEQVNNVTVVCFTVSSIVERNYEFVSDELFELVEYVTTNGPIQVVLDLSSIRQIDDWGLAMLRAFHETINVNGGTTILCRLPATVSRAISNAGLTDCFHCRDTRGEAIWYFQALSF